MASKYYLYPDGIDADNANWTAVGAVSKVDCIDELFGQHNDFTDFIQTVVASQTIRFSLSAMAAAISINSVTIRVWAQGAAGSVSGQGLQPYLRVSGGDYPGALHILSNSWTEVTDDYPTNPATSAQWLPSDLPNLVVGIGNDGTIAADSPVRVTSVLIEVDYVPAPVLQSQAREAGSRRLRLLRRPIGTVRLRLPYRYADLEIGDVYPVEHFSLPTPRDAGAGPKRWQRWVLQVLSIEENLDEMNVTVMGLVTRDFYCTFWDTMISEESPALSQGIARLDAGAGRVFTRASKAWGGNAAAAAQGITQIVEVLDDTELLATSGEQIEAAATNHLIQSSFKNGTTGWTTSGTGSNGSAIATDTATLLFDSAVSGNSIKFTSGSPIHVADLYLQSTTTASIGASTVVTGSFDHLDDSGAALSYAIQRGVDSKWWRDSDQTWQVALTWNAMTVATSAVDRHRTKAIDVGAGATTLTLRVGVPTASGVAGQINHLYHAQIETGPYATGRILTTTATYTRAAAVLKVENVHGRRTLNNPQFSGHVQFLSEWSTSDLAAGATRWLFDIQYDADNKYRVFYNQTTGAFIFRARIAAVNYDASKVTTVTRGTVYDIGWRAVGPEGEESLAPYTISVFVNGVKGTDANPGATPRGIPADSYIYWGSDGNGVNQCDGWLRHALLKAEALSDYEIADLP